MVHVQDLPTCLLLYIDHLSGGPNLQRAIFGVDAYIDVSIVKMNWNYFSSQKEWMKVKELERGTNQCSRNSSTYLLDPLGYESVLFYSNYFTSWNEIIKKHQDSWKTRKKMSRLKTKFRLSVRMKRRSVEEIHKDILFELEKRRWIEKVEKQSL